MVIDASSWSYLTDGARGTSLQTSRLDVMNYETYPNMNPNPHGSRSIRTEATAATEASTRQGIQARRITTNDNFNSFCPSKPSPAFVKMIAKAIALQDETNITVIVIC